jgi:hypothetical protein
MSPLRQTDLIAIALVVLAIGLSLFALAASKNEFPKRLQGGGGGDVYGVCL